MTNGASQQQARHLLPRPLPGGGFRRLGVPGHRRQPLRQPVHPLRKRPGAAARARPDGDYLYAVNTPDNRLEIFQVAALVFPAARAVGSVRVGLEPVAVAVRSGGEVWVVNHLSDSVSVVDVASSPPQSLRRADPARRRRAARHRVRRAGRQQPGLHHHRPPRPEQRHRPAADHPRGRPRRRLGFRRVDLGARRQPLTIVRLFADTPRALAVTAPTAARCTPPCSTSGNHTTTVIDLAVSDGGPSAHVTASPCRAAYHQLPGGHPAAGRRSDRQVRQGVRSGATRRPAGTGTTWSSSTCPTTTSSPSTPTPTRRPRAAGNYAGVGTILFNMAVNPVSGKVYVCNTEAHNEVRFEGPGVLGGTTVRGHLHEARVTRARPGGQVAAASPQQAHRLRRGAAPAAQRRRTPAASRRRSRWR